MSDLSLVRTVQHDSANRIFDLLMPLLSRAGELQLVWLVLLVAIVVVVRTRAAVWLAGVALLATLVADAVTAALKQIVDRPRPFVVDPHIHTLVAHPSSASFPSGHASSSFACATAICLRLATVRSLSLAARRTIGACVVVLAVAIAFSRVYVGVHYVSDVAAGAALGFGCAVLVELAAVRIRS